MQKTLRNLPDTERFNGTVNVTAITGMLRPILVLEEAPEKVGPPIALAIDYYAPAAAARLGLPVNRTLYVLKEKGLHDDKYKIVDLSDLVVDPWGRTHAGGGDTVWREMPRAFYENLMDTLGLEYSNMTGMTWAFAMSNGYLENHKIGGYDGENYYSVEGKKIKGRPSKR